MGVSAIEPTRNGRMPRLPRRVYALLGAAAVAGLLLLSWTSSALAGRSSTGKPAFYPCTRCHPVTVGLDGKPVPPLPNGFEKHRIELEVHDVLGADEHACLACHDDPARNPGKLLLPDGNLVDITGNVSRVCQRCHSTQYREWRAGIHGKHQPKCTSAGCHDPHTPSWIYVPALPPFQGTGMEVRAVSAREPFRPLAGPPVDLPVETPAWLGVLTSLGAAVSAGILGYLILGASKR